MIKYCLHILVVFSILFSASTLSSQNVKKLEDERKATLKRMETTNKMLNETKKSQKSSLNKLNILESNIKERKSLINTINKELVEIDKEVETLNSQREKLDKRLVELKKDYTRLVEEAYINQSTQNKLMFILSGENFNQTYRRLRYLQEYSAYRKEQVHKIEKINKEIESKNDEVLQHRTKKVFVLQQKETETRKLALNKKTEKKMFDDLKKKERNLQENLKKQQEKANQLNKRIEKEIADEINRNKKEREKEKKSQKTETKNDIAKTTPKEDLIANANFEKNRGRLPWPTEQGIIVGKYGIRPHPVLKNITTNNKGIYIQTPKASDARAVFEGEVTQRFSIQGSNNAVIVKHGVYRTVYANLTEIYVRVGDKVKPKQRIGRIYTDDENEAKTELYFQIWKEKSLLNPELWIVK